MPDSSQVNSGVRKPIRMVFVVDNMRVGGSELNAVRTAEHLDRSRFDLRVVCFDIEGPVMERYRSLDVPVIHMPIGSLHGIQMLRAGGTFMRYLRTEGIQVVHSHDMYSNIFAVPWARMARTPVVVASRRWWYSLPNAKLRVGNTMAFRMSSAVLANSNQVAESVRCSDGVRRDRIRVISNFADDSAFAPLDPCERKQHRMELGLSDGELVIGCVARLVPVKDHATLLRAFALVRATRASSKLVLVGDGPSRGTMSSLANELGIGDAVVFAGARMGRMNYHQLFDISVLASQSEGFPNTLVEAMAAGRPVVATAVGGNRDAVADGDTGRLVPVGDVGAFASALGELCDSPQLRARYGAAGLARARTEYRAERVMALLEGMYHDLIRARAA